MPKKKAATKRRRPAKKKAPPAPPLDDAIVGRVILLLVSLQDPALVARACTDKLDLPADAVDATITEARRRITLAADYHRVAELGAAITRLNDCYARSLAIQDVKTALAAQKELNKLLDLYRPVAATPGDPDDLAGEAAEELAAVREYLAPLDLGGPDDSVAELARRAVAHFAEIEAGD